MIIINSGTLNKNLAQLVLIALDMPKSSQNRMQTIFCFKNTSVNSIKYQFNQSQLWILASGNIEVSPNFNQIGQATSFKISSGSTQIFSLSYNRIEEQFELHTNKGYFTLSENLWTHMHPDFKVVE